MQPSIFFSFSLSFHQRVSLLMFLPPSWLKPSCILPSSLFHSSGFSLSSPLFNETVLSYAVVPWPLSSQSYLSFMEFEMTFRPSSPDGTLLYSDDAGSGDFLAINLVDRYVEFRFDCGSGGAVIRYWMNSHCCVPLPPFIRLTRCIL